MPERKTYGLFISHAWDYGDDYDRLCETLENAPNFRFRNYSVPEHDPLINPNTPAGQVALTRELDAQVRPVNCVLVISGLYAACKFWIQKEIDLALGYQKPILGIVPWGQEQTPIEVQAAAMEMVGWNTESIVSAIRRQSI